MTQKQRPQMRLAKPLSTSSQPQPETLPDCSTASEMMRQACEILDRSSSARRLGSGTSRPSKLALVPFSNSRGSSSATSIRTQSRPSFRPSILESDEGGTGVLRRK